MADKPRVRVAAGSSPSDQSQFVKDSFQNFAAGLGLGANNLSSGSTYSINPISRNRLQLEALYRGSWLVKKVVDVVADDMTRAGISFNTDMPPDDTSKFYQYLNSMRIWPSLNATVKWSRLYGGAAAVIVIDGQNPATPLNMNTIQKDQFKGLMVMDRWQLWPAPQEIILEPGVNYGHPVYYDVTADARSMPKWRIHHSRLIRIDGVELPYWQKMAENGWGMSVIEPMFDRQVAFDSATTGAAQLVFRAHLRTVQVEQLREVIAAGGQVMAGLQQYFGMMRLMQSNEGLTILDAADKFETHSYGFGGISDILIQLGQQIAGATDIPLVRLFGQSPAGLSATGESDIRNYYDFINAQQNARLHQPLLKVLGVAHRSLFGIPLPNGFDVSFNPLWQLTPEQKVGIAKTMIDTLGVAMDLRVIDTVTAMQEFRQSSKLTGVGGMITDEMIAETEANPPEAMQEEMEQNQLEGSQAETAMKQNAVEPEKSDEANRQMSFKEDRQTVFDFQNLPLRDFHGLKLVMVEGQSDFMDSSTPVHEVGHIIAPYENIGCVLGPDKASVMVWVVDKAAYLGFTSRNDVLAIHGTPQAIEAMSMDEFKAWLETYKYGESVV